MTGGTNVNPDRRLAVACALLATGVGAVAAVGVFARGSGPTQSVVSVRGEHFDMITQGVYAYNAERLVAEGVAWDFFTLFVAVPALALAALGLWRHSLRAKLVAMGLLAYFFYQYLMYAVAWAFGPLFLPFVVLYSTSLALLLWLASTLNLKQLVERCGPRFPLRPMAYFSFSIAGLLVLMWLGRIVRGLTGDLTGGMLLGQTTMVVQALDLGLIVPLAVWTGSMALKRRPIGYLLAAVVAVKGVSMSLAISLMVIHAAMVQGSLDWVGLCIFSVATAVCLWLGSRMWRSLASAQREQVST